MNHKSLSIGIIDYGVGNIKSLTNIIDILGHRSVLGNHEKCFLDSDILLMPGVGSMGYAMAKMRQTGMDKFIKERFNRSDIPIVGICLGMHLFFEYSEEDSSPGLSLLSGNVSPFENLECHVGWNLVNDPSWVKEIEKPSAYYFNHSYKVSCDTSIIYKTAYQQKEIPAIVQSNLFTGVQFHPEKSQLAGYNLLKNNLFVV